MKKISILFTIILLLGITLTAQAQFINYQGVARDNAGNILINQPIALRLSVLSGSAVGTAVYVETHATTTDGYGLFTLQIGQGTVVTGVFNDIAWSSTSFFLKVEIDPTGGTNYGLAGTTQFAAVPYSLHAKTADNGFSGNYNDLTNQPVLFDGAFGSLTGKPSTLAGYGITDAMNINHVANGITTTNITNWDATFGWGNHAGLYRPISYVPAWGEVTGKPVFATVATSGSYNDLNNKPTGTNPGDMLYWDGTTWIAVPVGTTGQVLKLNNAIPTWTSFASLPSLITNEATSITNTTANTGGTVSDGGALVTARGVCWGTSPNPTIDDSKTIDGNGSGSFNSAIIGLSVSTTYFARAYATNSVGTAYGNQVSFTTLNFTCVTSSLTINHVTTDGVAPVDKTVTYATITNIPGEPNKCWIAKNLGATNQATSVSDATEAAAGWYWQFNRKQGFKHDGTTRSPATTWISSIYENSNWVAANDPCSLELGSTWRMPTYTEWTNVDASGAWTTWTGPYGSGLKLHAAGVLSSSDGMIFYRGSSGYYFSTTQSDASYGWYLTFYNSTSTMFIIIKSASLTARCLRD